MSASGSSMAKARCPRPTSMPPKPNTTRPLPGATRRDWRCRERSEAPRPRRRGSPRRTTARPRPDSTSPCAALAARRIQAADAEYQVAAEDLKLLQRGSRFEDIAASEARLTQAQAALTELLNGSRREERPKRKPPPKPPRPKPTPPNRPPTNARSTPPKTASSSASLSPTATSSTPPPPPSNSPTPAISGSASISPRPTVQVKTGDAASSRSTAFPAP